MMMPHRRRFDSRAITGAYVPAQYTPGPVWLRTRPRLRWLLEYLPALSPLIGLAGVLIFFASRWFW